MRKVENKARYKQSDNGNKISAEIITLNAYFAIP
jgi:hypothetical protein